MPAAGDIDDAAVRAFYAIHSPAKLGDVTWILAEARSLGLTHEYVMQSLRTKYPACVTSDRGRTPLARPAEQTPLTKPPMASSGANVTGRATESNGAAATTSAAPYGDAKWNKVDSAAAKSRTDQVLLDEVRGWILQVLQGFDRPEMELLRGAANPVDALRNGALLLALALRLKNPDAMPPTTIRTSATNTFVNLQNVNVFTESAAAWVPNGCLFHGPDLCEGRNDRAVVTCLLAVGRWALENGRAAPRVAKLEKEIDEMPTISDAEQQAMIAAAEETETLSQQVVTEADADPTDIDFAIAAVLGPPSPLNVAAPPPASPIAPVASAVESRAPVASPTTVKEEASRGPVGAPIPASPKRYRAKEGDAVDERVGRAFNSFLAQMHIAGRHVHSRIVRTRNQGEYIIYHKITGRRTVVYVRELSTALMLRVGGGWEDFDSYLARRLVDVECVPKGTIEERDRQQRRRANTGLH